jgi:hypothetical protein
MSSVELVDPRRGTHLATLYPVDKERNADRRRRVLGEPNALPHSQVDPAHAGIAPLMRQYMADYAATGLPPAYLPHDTTIDSDDDLETNS